MTYDELQEKLSSLFPDFSVDTDNQGQLIIYTNKKVSDGELVPITNEDPKKFIVSLLLVLEGQEDVPTNWNWPVLLEKSAENVSLLEIKELEE